MSNIIRAIFNNVNDKEVFAKARYQYDYGMVLRFEGAVTLPSAFEVHFALSKHGEAITQIGNSEGVPVPDALFLAGKTIYAWAYLHSGEDDGYTEYMVQIPVIQRAQPSDEVPTPVQQSAIDQAIAALGVAVEQTAADVETTTEKATEAAASAEDATNSAAEAAETAENVEENVTAARAAKADAEAARDRAVQAETSASQSKTAAATSESNAAASASAAATSSTNAASSASTASTAASTATSAKDTAVSKASEATTAASTATTKASEASASATAAAGSATTASTKASEAAASATTASTAASTATTKAGEAATSATNAAASAESVASSAAQIATNAADITALKADLGIFNFFNGMSSGFIPTSGTEYPITNASYPNATYVIIDLLAGHSLKIAGFASANTAGRARCIVNGEIISSVAGNTTNYTTTVNLSASINNGTITALKDIQIALMFLDGIVPSDVKATIDGFASVSEMLFDTYNKTFSLEDSVDALSDDLDDAETDLEALAVKTFDVRDLQYLVPNIPNITKASGYSVSAGATSVQIDVNANYDSYWCITDKPLTLYAVPTAGQYYALGVLTDASGSWEEHTNYNIMRGTAGARYRSSDNNLPTQNAPLTVPAGTLLVYTFPASSYYSAVYEDQVSNVLNNSVRLNDWQLAQIPNQKKVYFKYSATSGGDSSSEHVDVYVPYKDGLIHYLVVHTESQSINSDVWRISLAYITDSSFSDVTQITTSGEWECAIHLPDRDDFSGGYAHGDEVLINNPAFYKDGLPITITDYTDYTSCDEFTFVERTNMYDPADNTRAIAQHGSAHIFATDKLKIQQSLLWLVDTALTNTYLAMLPIAKAVSSHFYTNARHIVTEIGNTSHTESKATEAVIYGDEISCKFSVPVYSPTSAYFFETDNGGSAYNKCYFAVAATSVTHGDVWMTETDYEFS